MMKLHNRFRSILTVVSIAVASLALANHSGAQSAGQFGGSPPAARLPGGLGRRSVDPRIATLQSLGMGHPVDPRTATLQLLNELKTKLRESNEETRPSLIAEIEEAVLLYFEQDMEHRDQELVRLVNRANEMEARNKKRQDARSELIDLQVEAFLQEADGLGLFGPPQRTTGSPLRLSRSALNPFIDQKTSAVAGPADAREVAVKRIEAARRDLAGAVADGEQKARDEAVEELKAALGEYFDRDMEFRQSELAKIRTGLDDMQKQHQKRADAKKKIIALQLKIITNDAEGLGFYPEPRPVSGMPGTPGTGSPGPARQPEYPQGSAGYDPYGPAGTPGRQSR